MVELGYENGRAIVLTLDARNVVAIGLPDGHWRFRRYPYLVEVVKNPPSLFAYTRRETVLDMSGGACDGKCGKPRRGLRARTCEPLGESGRGKKRRLGAPSLSPGFPWLMDR